VERWNRSFQEVLVRLTDGAVTRWDRIIHKANMALRMRTSRITGMSPFEILYGVKTEDPWHNAIAGYHSILSTQMSRYKNVWRSPRDSAAHETQSRRRQKLQKDRWRLQGVD